MTKIIKNQTIKGAGRFVDRRTALRTAGRGAAAAALFSAIRAAFPAGVFAADAGPEVPGAKLGFIALTDSAPLIIAKEKGFFAKYGVPEMSIEKQASWAATRDNIELGSGAGGIDGAHPARTAIATARPARRR